MVASRKMREAQCQYGGHPGRGCDRSLPLLQRCQSLLKGPDSGIGIAGIDIAIRLTRKGFAAAPQAESKTKLEEVKMGSACSAQLGRLMPDRTALVRGPASSSQSPLSDVILSCHYGIRPLRLR
jgi:hypothetical protein